MNRHEQAKREYDKHYRAMLNRHELKDTSAAMTIYTFAWREGHSAGLDEVQSWFDELVLLYCGCRAAEWQGEGLLGWGEEDHDAD